MEQPTGPRVCRNSRQEQQGSHQAPGRGHSATAGHWCRARPSRGAGAWNLTPEAEHEALLPSSSLASFLRGVLCPCPLRAPDLSSGDFRGARGAIRLSSGPRALGEAPAAMANGESGPSGEENGVPHHRVLGAKHFVRHNPRTDRFDVERFHHVEFWCAESRSEPLYLHLCPSRMRACAPPRELRRLQTKTGGSVPQILSPDARWLAFEKSCRVSPIKHRQMARELRRLQ